MKKVRIWQIKDLKRSEYGKLKIQKKVKIRHGKFYRKNLCSLEFLGLYLRLKISKLKTLKN